MKDITKSDLLNNIYTNPMVLVQWYEPWCTFCMGMEETTQALYKKFGKDVVFLRISPDKTKTWEEDVDIQAEKFFCKVTPTYIIFEEGTPIYRNQARIPYEEMERVLVNLVKRHT